MRPVDENDKDPMQEEQPVGSGEKGPDPPPASAETQALSQADVDALLGGGASGGERDGDVQQATVQEDGPQATGQQDTRVDSLGRPFDEAAAAMQAAIRADQDVQTGGAPPLDAKPFELSDLSDSALGAIDARRVSMLNDVNLRVKIQLGQTRMLVEDVLKLNKGSVVELDKLAGDPVDVYVNDRLIARGEVLVLNDAFCVRISEVLSHDPHRVSAK